MSPDSKTRTIQSNTLVSRGLVFGGLLMLFASLSPMALAQRSKGPTFTPGPPFNCSNSTLSGRFATRGSGFTPANPFDPASPLVPFANVSLMTFDGEGGLTNAAVNSNNGTIIPGSSPGTYELNGDCTGTLTIAAPVGILTFYLVVADRGTKFFTISTVNRSVVTVEGSRVQ